MDSLIVIPCNQNFIRMLRHLTHHRPLGRCQVLCFVHDQQVQTGRLYHVGVLGDHVGEIQTVGLGLVLLDLGIDLH